jgi:SAM-dependent methyltransferase
MTSDAPKTYDQSYFDRWYRGDDPPKGEGELHRTVALAVAVAESILNRPIETVLDVGCGEGRWYPVLQELRPGVRYLGIEPSEYAVERFGDARNIRQGTFGELGQHVFEEPFDLVVCADVLHYLTGEEILTGVGPLGDLVGGAACLEVFTEEDEPLGDLEGFHLRPALWYRRVFESAELVPVGLQMHTHREMAEQLESLDLAGPVKPTGAS